MMRRSISRYCAVMVPSFVGDALCGRITDSDIHNHFFLAQEEQVAHEGGAKQMISQEQLDAVKNLGSSNGLGAACEEAVKYYVQGSAFTATNSDVAFMSPDEEGTLTVKEGGKKFTASGSKIALFGGGAAPKHIAMFANTDGKLGCFKVPVAGSGCTVKKSSRFGKVGWDVTCNDAPCEIVAQEASPVDVGNQMLSKGRVATASGFAGVMSHLALLATRHATSTARYQTLLVYNHAVQRRISEVTSGAYGVEALASYVAVHGNVEEASLLKILAAQHLTTALNNVDEVLSFQTLDGPHRSNEKIIVDRSFVNTLRGELPLYTQLDGTNLDIAKFVTVPLMEGAAKRGGGSGGSAFDALWGNGQAKLSNPHVNLQSSAKVIEEDVAALMKLLHTAKQPAKSDLIIQLTAAYTAELFASVATVYRASAAMSNDETAAGHWELAQVFCDVSHRRRMTMIHNVKTMQLAKSKVGLIHDDIIQKHTTHPTVLANSE